MSIKGGRVGSVKSLKSSLKKSSGGTGFLQRIPKDGLTVRFLDEPEEWIEFYEFYDEGANRYYPVSEEGPQAEEGQRTSKRFLVNAVDTSDNKVIPLVLPVTAAKPLVAMYEKYGTLTDRDYELVREGEGLETEYRALPESPQKMRLSKFERLDLIEFLEAQIGGDDDEDDEPRAKPKSKAAPARKGQAIKRRRQVDDEDDDLADVDDDDPPFKSNVKRGGGRIVKSTKTTGRSTSSSKTKAGPARRPMRRS